MAFYDEYVIEQSIEIESEGREETRTDLQLEVNADKEVGVVSGTVVDTEGNPVPNATVKLNTATIQPYAHTSTNAQGKFTITKVAAGSYLIAAIKEGYLLSTPISITVVQNKTTTVTIELASDPKANKNIVFGIVKSNINNNPVNQAVVQLYKKEAEENVYIGVSITNPQGQYLFINLDDGDYFVSASKIGYITTETLPINVSGKQYLPQDVILTSDPSANTGVICGIITDKATGLPVPNALVALYSIVGEVETIMKLTETNVEGKYLFGDIETGKYRIKSTVQSIEE